MNFTPSFWALGEPGTHRVPAREPCDPESIHRPAQVERWIPDSTVCRAGFLRNPGQTGFRNDDEKLPPFHVQLPCGTMGEYAHRGLPFPVVSAADLRDDRSISIRRRLGRETCREKGGTEEEKP